MTKGEQCALSRVLLWALSRALLKWLHVTATPEVLEGLVSTSKWPRNVAKFLASSCPRSRKTRIKSLVLKMAEKKAEIRHVV